ncbi:hypothetical protein [Candidatus Odyssella thessalonicensis]|uniref:hypothetical protein n=1 Tax=Candidatus Odyssella thessalonicensis TaxID=84647 RepID=UPI000225AEBB|nr:hypothetical protein [Candidatus Odyssella thessalonicensis]
MILPSRLRTFIAAALLGLLNTAHAADIPEPDKDIYQDQDLYPYSPSLPSLESQAELRLVKTDLNKYLRRKLLWQGSLDIPYEYCDFIESLISNEIHKTLIWLKRGLGMRRDLQDLTLPDELQEQIKKASSNVIKGFDKIAPLIITSADKTINEQEYHHQYALLIMIFDTYFKDQLLWIAYHLLQPVPPSKTDSHHKSPQIKRLVAYDLLIPPLTGDSLALWQSKRDHFYLLNQVVRISTASFTEFDLQQIKEKTNISLNCTLDDRQLIRYFDNSCTFLGETFLLEKQNLENVNDFLCLSEKILGAELDLYRHYQELFPNLMVQDKIKIDVQASLAPHLITLHQTFFENLIHLYLNTVTRVNEIKEAQAIAEQSLFFAEKIHNQLIRHVGNLVTNNVKATTHKEMSNLYKTSIHNLFTTTLNFLEQHYQQRSLFTKALTSLGGRTSQTQEFFKKLKQICEERFLFLAAPSVSPNLCLVDSFERLEKQMLETDQSTVEPFKKVLSGYW